MSTYTMIALAEAQKGWVLIARAVFWTAEEED